MLLSFIPNTLISDQTDGEISFLSQQHISQKTSNFSTMQQERVQIIPERENPQRTPEEENFWSSLNKLNRMKV